MNINKSVNYPSSLFNSENINRSDEAEICLSRLEILIADSAALISSKVENMSVVVSKLWKISSIFAAILVGEKHRDFRMNIFVSVIFRFYIKNWGQRSDQSAAVTDR